MIKNPGVAFWIRDRVEIIEIETVGKIVAIEFVGDNIFYNVQYPLNGKIEYQKLEQDDLRKA